MKTTKGILAGLLAAWALYAVDSRAADSAQSRSVISTAAETELSAPGVTATAAPQVRVIVRGWEIQSAQATRRLSVTRFLPDYRQRKLVGNVKSDVAPKKGEFLVVLVQSQWATAQPPNEPLWIGKPDVVLVDDQGAEYPAVDTLGWQSGEYLARGMGSTGRREQRVGRTNQTLVYFDVPSSAGRTFRLRLSKDSPLLPVTRVVNLPQVDLSRVQ